MCQRVVQPWLSLRKRTPLYECGESLEAIHEEVMAYVLFLVIFESGGHNLFP